MRATIEFSLPEEEEVHRHALRGVDYHGTLWDVDQRLRDWLKYGHEFKSADEALGEARRALHEIMEARGVKLS